MVSLGGLNLEPIISAPSVDAARRAGELADKGRENRAKAKPKTATQAAVVAANAPRPGDPDFIGPVYPEDAQFIGVPKGHRGRGGKRPMYQEGLQFAPGGWSVEQRYQLQRTLVRSGLLSSDFQWKMWDEASRNAYYDLLTYSNQNGLSVDEAADELQSMAPSTIDAVREMMGRDTSTSFIAPVRKTLSPETKAARISELADKVFDRKLDNTERAQLIAKLAEGYDTEYEQELLPAAQMEHQAQQQAAAKGAAAELIGSDPRFTDPENPDALPGDVESWLNTPIETGTVVDVDPEALLAEYVENAYAPEIRELKSKRQSAEAVVPFVANLTNVANALTSKSNTSKL